MKIRFDKKSFFCVLIMGLLMSCSGTENQESASTNQQNNENENSNVDDSIMLDEMPADAGPEDQLFAQPQNIEEYFYKMPSQWVHPDKLDGELTDEEKKQMISKKDLVNGYLKLEGVEGYEWPGYTEMGLWKKPNEGGDLIGVNVVSHYAEDAPKHYISFYEFKDGGWNDVTEKIFKPLSDSQIEEIYGNKIEGDIVNPMTGLTHVTYNFPVKGTTIDILFEDNNTGDLVKVSDYKFKNGKFVLSFVQYD